MRLRPPMPRQPNLVRLRSRGECLPTLGWLAIAHGLVDDAHMKNAPVTGSAEAKPAPHPNGSVAESSRAVTSKRVTHENGGALTARTRVALFRPARFGGQLVATIHWRSGHR
jgi:hypothetical protein